MSKHLLRLQTTASFCLMLGVSAANAGASDDIPPADNTGREQFSLRVVATGLAQPWEVTWGPDDHLWVTERTGKRVTRVDPLDGSRSTAVEIDDVYQSSGQDGVLGMALHPELLQGTGNDFVYIAFTYDAGVAGVLDRRTKLTRYEYDALTSTLGDPHDLVVGLPASSDHNSGRLVFGPDAKLYFTIGDQGANQFDNKCLTNRAQELPSREQLELEDWSAYAGKVVRLNLDGSIPDDNPILNGVRSHVYSYGHRNAQGVVFAPDGKLYAAEHGPKSDDEINWIRPGQNYGWPRVAGYRDDQSYAYANWSLAPDCSSLAFDDYVVPDSVPVATESSWPDPFVPPLRTLYTVPEGYDFHDPACAGNYYICWPTVAPASLDIYAHHHRGIPGWANSLLIVSLKRGAVLRAKLARDGTSVAEPVEVFRTIDRYRDIAVGPDGRTFYVVTDSEGQTSGPTQGYTALLEHPGALLAFTYVPPAGNGN
jgi:PQQ-dependent dehydrogenase (s-GDH family)